MKKAVFLFVVGLLLQAVSVAQKDTALERRLQEFMQVNERMELEKVLDYTYPKLYTLVPREKMLEALKTTFSNEELSVKLDSLRINSVFPVFGLENGWYAKVVYSMNMLMTFKDDEIDSLSAEEKKERDDYLVTQMESEYGNGNVSIDAATGSLKVRTISRMVAIKDSYAKQWCFVNLEEDHPFMERLFSKAVLNKLATYK